MAQPKRDPVQEQLAVLRKKLAATDARVAALTMSAPHARQDHERDQELLELRAANEVMRASLVGVQRAPLRPAFHVPVLLGAIPGLAAQFRGVVPAANTVLPSRGPETTDVRCRCEAVVAVDEGTVEGCECGRWFMRLDGAVHVARPRPDQTRDAAEGPAPTGG